MAPVSQPRGPAFEDAKMRYIDVAEALTKGTEGIIGIAEAMPDFMDRMTGGQYTSTRPNQNPAQQGVPLH